MGRDEDGGGPGQQQDPALDRFCRGGSELPLSSKNLFDFGPFKNKQQDPAVEGILLQGRRWRWSGCVPWCAGLLLNFPFPPHFAGWMPKIHGQELICSTRALAPAPQTHNSELSDPCHESPSRRL